MFHLEQSITAWRKQLVDAGIRTPVPLELETHLREEIDRQLLVGLSEQAAFHAAVQNLGPAAPLKAEFAKTDSRWSRFGQDNFTRTNRILGTLWLLSYLWGGALLWQIFTPLLHPPHFFASSIGQIPILSFDFQIQPFYVNWWIVLPILALFSVGFFGSVCLLRGAKIGRRIIGLVACLELALSISAILQSTQTAWCHTSRDVFWFTLHISFDFLTLWFLSSRKFRNPKPAN